MRTRPPAGIVAAMITRQRIAALVACLSLLAVAAAAAGADGAKTERQLDIVKRVTTRFKDVLKAEAAGYVAVGECVATKSGAMGVHYLNAALLGDPKLDLRRPELLLYEPQESGKMRLVGVEWMQLDSGQRAPRLFGRRFDGPMNHNGTAPWHFDLHVWTVRKNPRGTFAQYNRRVSCDAG
jgi:hypothetical protein